MVEMRMCLSDPSQKSKITNICVGVSQNFFWPIFLDVFFDVDSDKKKIFDFWPFFDWDIAVFLILTIF